MNRFNNSENYNSVQINSTLEDNILSSNGTGSDTVPQWTVNFYFVFAFFGSLANLIYIFAILTSKRNGTLLLVLQISFVDTILFYVAILEIYTIQKRSWIFSAENCQFFSGMEIVMNTLIVYLLLCLNCHIISLWNLNKFEVNKENNPLTSCRDDSDECLVTKNENKSNTAYRTRNIEVSVVFPSIFIWFVSVSLSIPSFTLSSILNVDEKYNMCGIEDGFYGEIMQKLLLVFKIVIPFSLLMFSLVVLVVIIFKTTRNRINNSLTKKFTEIRILLIFSVLITLCFFLTSTQRNVLFVYHYFNLPFQNTDVNFIASPFFANTQNSKMSLYFSMLYYTGSSVRGCLYFYVLPKFRHLLTNKVMCFDINK
ncbi:unnamed protein product [Brassicogethes aeneus]|uniref:G-protein coupled receptors family 1 profile domain-containing protein n=1 Tax=Brassicogethes aeneus TaxID=1431903 RepID=A0A9P0AYR7_BRAAE|nr:unnamed protein product [Brassicogethes aeneus]